MNEIKQKNKISIGDFKFIKEIGQGTFGSVYLANKKNTNSLFAIKAVSKHRLFMSQSLDGFFMEKLCLKIFKHPYIVRNYATFQNPQDIFYIMEYLSGGDFEHLLQKEKLTEDEIRKYSFQILIILEHIHDKGVMHRDIKLENFVLDDRKNIKLIDFGSARFYKKTHDTRTFLDELEKSKKEFKKYLPASLKNKSFTRIVISSTELEKNISQTFSQKDKLMSSQESKSSSTQIKPSIFGTALFLSPEVEFGNVDQMNDLWALGICMFYMLTKQYPFQGNEIEVYEKILYSEPQYALIVFLQGRSNCTRYRKKTFMQR